LGTSSNAIRKYIQGMPDLRRHGRRVAPGTVVSPQGQHVDFFFYELYCSAAEPLPEDPSGMVIGDAGDPDISHKLGPWDAQDDVALQETVDRILEKISRSGEASLTSAERETLTQASRRLKERMR
jgi:hypothetical protein